MITFKKSPDKDFVILNITDTHIEPFDWNEDNGNTKILDKTLKELIETNKPDLITLTGDYSTKPYFYALARFADYMESFGIPWAPVWGNHDNSGLKESPMFMEYVSDMFIAKPHCILEKGDPEMGNGNYIIKIEENGKPVTALFMMDSHRGDIFPSQINWFNENIKTLKAEGCNDAAIFMHMPLTEHETAIREALIGDFSAMDRVELAKFAEQIPLEDTYNGKCWEEGYKDSFGAMREKVCPIDKNDEWFDAILASGITKNVVVGHEHSNNFSIKYRGVRLTYALKVGMTAWGRIPFNGGTVFHVSSNGLSDPVHQYVDITGMPYKIH